MPFFHVQKQALVEYFYIKVLVGILIKYNDRKLI